VKVSALIAMHYEVNGNEVTEEFIETVDVNNRNARSWDDNRKISAFVTARDPAIMRFARNVSSYIQDGAKRGNSNLMLPKGLKWEL
jgi:hypothetical protein